MKRAWKMMVASMEYEQMLEKLKKLSVNELDIDMEEI